MAPNAATSGLGATHHAALMTPGTVVTTRRLSRVFAAVRRSTRRRALIRQPRATQNRCVPQETIPGATRRADLRRAKRVAAGGRSTSRRPADEARDRESSARVRRCSAGPGNGSSTPSAQREPGRSRGGASGSPGSPSRALPGTAAAVRRERVEVDAWTPARDPRAVAARPSPTREWATCPQARGRRTWRRPSTVQARSLREASAALRGLATPPFRGPGISSHLGGRLRHSRGAGTPRRSSEQKGEYLITS